MLISGGSLPVTLKTVCLLLAATGRAGDVSTAVRVFSQYWTEVSSLKVSKLYVDLIYAQAPTL